LAAGWYVNNCHCYGGHCDTADCFAGDVNAALAYGSDSIKRLEDLGRRKM
jgi:hypothetical protein